MTELRGIKKVGSGFITRFVAQTGAVLTEDGLSKSWYGSNAKYVPGLFFLSKEGTGHLALYFKGHRFEFVGTLALELFSYAKESGKSIVFFQIRRLSKESFRLQIDGVGSTKSVGKGVYKEVSLSLAGALDDFFSFVVEGLTEFSNPIYGGKGEGLIWLSNQGVNVPSFYILPINVYRVIKNTPSFFVDFYLDFIYKALNKSYTFVSVRSGAEKSLPGLMDTILDVPVSDKKRLFQAIKNVWDSYTQVPESLKEGTTGTAVIIQEMVHGDRAGVVFPSFTKSGKIRFVFRYAKRGEDVVSGNSDDLGEVTFRKGDIYDLLKKITVAWVKKNYGANPPEFEIVQKGDEIYFLQVRDYKLADVEAEPFFKFLKKEKIGFITKKVKTIRPKGSFVIEGKGGLYGVGVLSDSPQTSPYILVVESGISLENSHYVEDENCKGIIWRVGSPHAHLGVLCRNHNKAFAKIDDPRLNDYFGQEILLFDGKIYTDTEYEEIEKIVKSAGGEFKFGKIGISKKLTDSELNSESQAIKDLIEYKTWLLSDRTTTIPYKYIRRLFWWGLCSSLGELRYWTQYDNPEEPVKEIGRLIGAKLYYKHKALSRSSFYNKVRYTSLARIIEALRIAENCFYEFEFSSGYGGPRWAEIAGTTADLAEAIRNKDLKALIDAVNTLEHLEHNNSIFFDKFISTYNFRVILDLFNEVDTIEEWCHKVKNRGYEVPAPY